MKNLLGLLIVLSAVAVFSFSSHLQAELVVGTKAPDFTLPDSFDEEHSLSDFAGKYIVLEWVNDQCPFVKKHYESGNMQDLQTQYTAKDVVWLSVASSAKGKQGYHLPHEWNEIMEEQGAAQTAILLDPWGKVGKLYGAQTTPHMYIINPEGQLIYQGAIDSKSSANPADIESSTNYVQQALDESMAGLPVSEPSTKAYGCSVKYA